MWHTEWRSCEFGLGDSWSHLLACSRDIGVKGKWVQWLKNKCTVYTGEYRLQWPDSRTVDRAEYWYIFVEYNSKVDRG